jgi:TRAP transporter TAXI family solute receptor
MDETQFTRVSRRYVVIGSVAAAVLLVAAVAVVLAIINPTPPRTVVMTTGSAGSAYSEVAERYREILARDGVELRLVPSAGAVENLNRLSDPRAGVSVGFIQGGITNARKSPELVSLGTVFYEPLWFFYRNVQLSRGLSELRGKRISIGPEGSGTRALTLELLARNGIDQSFAELLPFTPEMAGEKLLSGQIQAAIMLTSWDSPVVRRLVAATDVDLVSFPRTDAYVALYPFLNKLVLPTGVGDLAKNRPPRDVILIAPKASLVVRRDLHPAIQYLLLDAASEIHEGPGIFHKAGQFPAAEATDLPLSNSAHQYYKSGRPFLQRYLPFWLAVLAGQLLILAIPVVGVLYPMLRLAPAVYGWGMRRRIYRLYGQLKFLEIELDRRRPEQDVTDLVGKLDRLEERANHLRVPAAFAHMLYTLRMHMSIVRTRIEKR